MFSAPKPDTWDKYIVSYYPFVASEKAHPGSLHPSLKGEAEMVQKNTKIYKMTASNTKIYKMQQYQLQEYAKWQHLSKYVQEYIK